MILGFVLRFLVLVMPVALFSAIALSQERTDVFVASRDHPAIAYTSAATTDAVASLFRPGTSAARLAFDDRRGYLDAVLGALAIPVESQVLVFSQTSAQAERISMAANSLRRGFPVVVATGAA